MPLPIFGWIYRSGRTIFSHDDTFFLNAHCLGNGIRYARIFPVSNVGSVRKLSILLGRSFDNVDASLCEKLSPNWIPWPIDIDPRKPRMFRRDAIEHRFAARPGS